ncbi:MAG TPA: hypothetical protein VN622_09070 [Clostridia bacterium]|nr:hypothetical protein [Clostridia bacterium]
MNTRDAAPWSLRKKLLFAVGILILLLWPIALVIPARADVVVTGNIKSLLTKPVASRAYVRAKLENCTAGPKALGVLLDTTHDNQVEPDAAGNFTITLYRNDTEIDCDGAYVSTYEISIVSNGRTAWKKSYIFNTATADLATYPSLATTPPSPAANYARRNGDNVFSGVQDFRGATLLGVTALSSSVEWENVLNKPATFVPAMHVHLKADIIDLPALATVATSGSYNDLSNKPTIPAPYTLPPASADALGGVRATDCSLLGASYFIQTINFDGTETCVQAATGSVADWNTLLNKPPLGTIASHAASEYQAAGSYEPANANIQAHVASFSNPHSVTKAQVGLGNVDNTSDAAKPISTATQTALATKADKASIIGAAKTKITYNAQGIVTAGADATTADIADWLDKRYVSDAQRTVLTNTSGSNTGDETIATIKTKLGITTLSGSNTGDQDLSGLVTKTTTVAGKPLSGNIALVASDVGSLADPAANGIVKRTAANTTAAAVAADVVAIFGSGACAGYLKSDGACDTPSGGGTTPLTAYEWGDRVGTLGFTSNQTRWYGINLPVSIAVSKVAVYVTTIDATGTYRFAIYNSAGVRVLTTAAQTLPATGNVEISFSEGLTTLPAGKYRFALSSASSTAAIAATNSTKWSFGSGLVNASATPAASFSPPADAWTGTGVLPYVVLYQ